MNTLTKPEYNELMQKIAEGGKVSRKTYDELVEFAKAKKVKKPAADSVLDEAAIKEAKTSAKNTGKAGRKTKEKVACDPSLVGSDEKCDKDSRSNGLCAAHYSRLVYRAKPENAEKARLASKNYAAKVRAEKAKVKAKAAA
jgi:hypothetical protein